MEPVPRRLIDISLPVSESLPVWPGDPPYRRSLAASLERGDPADVSRLDMGAHTGTHVDAPCHFVAGAEGVDRVPLEALVGPCTVVDARRAAGEVGPEMLPESAERVLFRTANSDRWRSRDARFDRDFVGLSPELADLAVARGVRMIGVDYLGVERFDAPATHPVHRALLGAGVAVVEGLDLSGVEAGHYEIWCLPLRLVGSDGAPARCVLTRI